MKIELLYIPDCPNHAASLLRLKSVLAEEGIRSTVQEIPVPDQLTAESLGFPGSPTIRIDGIDIEGSAPSPGLSCRTYAVAAGLEGVPPVELIRRAVRNAGSKLS